MKYFWLIGFLMVILVSPLSAEIKPPAPTSKTQTFAPEVLQEIEDYIVSIKTLKARFSQTAEVYANPLQGTFYLKRPGRLRFEYDPPIEDFIMADGTIIHYYDSELDTTSRALIGQTLAAFLVRKDPGLTNGKIEVVNLARETRDNLLGITVIKKGKPEKGRLTLIFQEKPTLELLKWQVVDSQGYVTQIELTDVEKGVDLDEDLFRDIPDPGFN